MTMRAWMKDLVSLAFVATLATAVVCLSNCLLAHPLLATLLVSTGGWYLYHRSRHRD